jgi:hypothetical protein
MAKKWRKINGNESNIGMAAKNNEESSVAKYQYQWRHGMAEISSGINGVITIMAKHQ